MASTQCSWEYLLFKMGDAFSYWDGSRREAGLPWTRYCGGRATCGGASPRKSQALPQGHIRQTRMGKGEGGQDVQWKHGELLLIGPRADERSGCGWMVCGGQLLFCFLLPEPHISPEAPFVDSVGEPLSIYFPVLAHSLAAGICKRDKQPWEFLGEPENANTQW